MTLVHLAVHAHVLHGRRLHRCGRIDEPARSDLAPERLLACMRFRPRALKDAFTPEFHTREHKAVWVLRLLLAALAVYSLSVEPTYTTKPLLFMSAAWGLVVSVGFAFIPTQRPRTLKAAEFGTLLAFALHVVGHALGWYQNYAWYDTLLHFSVPLVCVLILYALSQATDWIWDWRKVTPLEVGIYLFAMSVALGTLWEILEFGMDQLFGTREQDSLYDTMIDLIMDVSGAILGSVAAAWATAYGRKHGHDKVSEEPKRPMPMRAPRGASKE